MRWLLHNSWAILLIISGLLFAHALYLRYAPDYHHHHGNQWETTFQFDEELSAPLPPALKLDPKARLTLVALLPSDAFTNRVQYLGSLHRVHGGNGLTVIGVAPARRLRTATPQLPFDVVADSGSAIHATFRVPPEHGHGGVVLFDSERRVKFHAFGIPEQDELRQLVEKHLLGEVDYSYRTRRWGAIKAGEPLPVASFTRVGGDGGSPDARNRLLVLLPPGCASCQIDFLASQVSAAAGKAAGRKPAVVFAAEPDTQEWSSVSQILRPAVGEFWANRNPSLVWDDYYTRYSGEEGDPVVVATDSRGYVVSVKTVRETLGERQSP